MEYSLYRFRISKRFIEIILSSQPASFPKKNSASEENGSSFLLLHWILTNRRMKPRLGFTAALAIPFRIYKQKLHRQICKPLDTFPTHEVTTVKRSFHKGSISCCAKRMEQVSTVGKKRNGDLVRGKVFVVGDNIDTDQVWSDGYNNC